MVYMKPMQKSSEIPTHLHSLATNKSFPVCRTAISRNRIKEDTLGHFTMGTKCISTFSMFSFHGEVSLGLITVFPCNFSILLLECYTSLDLAVDMTGYISFANLKILYKMNQKCQCF